MKNTNNDDLTDAPRVALSVEQLESIARRKATCPFIGSVVKSGELSVLKSADTPLAAIDQVAELGDSGGGDLGSKVLKIFAHGNHNRMPGPSGALNTAVPDGTFSLDFGGSQGAHAGHSGILLGDPTQLDAGRFSAADFARLAKHADKNGQLSEEAIGDFIAENLVRDPNSKVLPIGDLAGDLFDFAAEAVDEALDGIAKLFGREEEEDENELLQKFTKLVGEDNLAGSSGEFGLLFALFANRPGQDMESDAGIRLDDVEQMMKHHRLPDGWETWPKTGTDWLQSTAKITWYAGKAYLRQNTSA